MMLFSIVVPVYNVEKYLDECLKSIITQITGSEFKAEVILVDDGSTDSSGAICDAYAEKYSESVKVFHKKNEGLLQTRRYGLEKAKGEYIINCDSDDMLAGTALNDLANIINKNYPDVIIYNMETFDEKGNTNVFFKDIFSSNYIEKTDKNEVLTKYLVDNSIVSMCCKCFKRKCIDSNIDYKIYGKISQGEDFMQSAEIYAGAESFVYYNKTLYFYRVGSGMTAKYNKDYYQESKVVLNHILSYIEEYNVYQKEKLMALKYFSIVGRAVTQSRLDKNLSFAKRRDFLQNIVNDEMYKENVMYFDDIKKELQTSHRLMCMLIIKQKYLLIDILLRLKNLI